MQFGLLGVKCSSACWCEMLSGLLGVKCSSAC